MLIFVTYDRALVSKTLSDWSISVPRYELVISHRAIDMSLPSFNMYKKTNENKKQSEIRLYLSAFFNIVAQSRKLVGTVS